MLAVALALYPFLIYFSYEYFNVAAIVILCLFLVRAFATSIANIKDNPLVDVGKYGAFIGIALCVGYFIFEQQQLLLFYPVMVNVTLLFFFARSLIHKPAIITLFAERFSEEFPEEHIPYTEKVTLAWCVFFGLNAVASLVTVLFFDIQIWTLYNGFISYLLIALMFAIEFVTRKLVLR